MYIGFPIIGLALVFVVLYFVVTRRRDTSPTVTSTAAGLPCPPERLSRRPRGIDPDLVAELVAVLRGPGVDLEPTALELADARRSCSRHPRPSASWPGCAAPESFRRLRRHERAAGRHLGIRAPRFPHPSERAGSTPRCRPVRRRPHANLAADQNQAPASTRATRPHVQHHVRTRHRLLLMRPRATRTRHPLPATRGSSFGTATARHHHAESESAPPPATPTRSSSRGPEQQEHPNGWSTVFLLCSRARNPGSRASRTRRWHLGDHPRNCQRHDHGQRRDRARSAPRPGLRRSVGVVAQVSDHDTCSDKPIAETDADDPWVTSRRAPSGTYALASTYAQNAGSGAGCAAAPSVVLCGRDECEPAVVASFRRFLLLVLILCWPSLPYRKRAGLSGTSRDRLRQGRNVPYDRPRAGPGRSIAAGLWGAIRGRL